MCKEHAKAATELNRLSDNDFFFPLHGQWIDIPTQDEIEYAVSTEDLSKFNSLLTRYLALDLHIRLRIQLKRLERLRRKKNAYPLDLLEVTIDSKEPITLGRCKDETEDAVFGYAFVSYLNVTLPFQNKGESTPTNLYFDVISENRDHTSYAQKSHLKKVFEHPRFKKKLH